MSVKNISVMEIKRFFRKLFSFVVTSLALFTAADSCLSHILYKHAYLPVGNLRKILEGNINADVLVMGGSRAWVMVDPSVLDSVLGINSYNLGLDGSQINRQVGVYNLYRLHNTAKPKLIIQNVDAFSLYWTNKYQIEQFFPYLWMPSYRKEIVSNFDLSFCDKYLPLIRFRGMKIHDVIWNSNIKQYKGYIGSDKKWKGSSEQKTDSFTFGVNDRTLQMFDSYLARCTEEGVKVVFAYAPIYGGAANIENSDGMYRTYQALADKYDIPVLDYTDMWISQDTSYFYNAAHLNKSGVAIYSDSLANDLKKIIK